MTSNTALIDALMELERALASAAAGIGKAISSITVEPSCGATDAGTMHRAAHRPGLPKRIDADPELRAFIEARISTHTYAQIAAEVAAHFPPNRRVGLSTIGRWRQAQVGTLRR